VRPRSPHAAVSLWLLGCALLVLAMIFIGGVTRLTHAGLSITEWKPILGAIPPLDGAAWQEEFARYQRSPEFRLINASMGLPEFQRIYLIEYTHRLLGRLVGLAFALPMLWFLARGALDARRAAFASGLLALGALQGGLGWFMVKSGLVDVPRVSPYRLAAHLTMALLLLVLLAWGAARELRPRGVPRIDGGLLAALVALGLTALWGALMAGLRAGYLFPSFPTMAGSWVPPGVFTLPSPWIDAVENPATVHFLHRLLALGASTLLLVAWWSWRSRLRGRLALALWWTIPSLLVLQILLGAATVLFHVPLPIAVAHQTNGALLLGVLGALGALLTPPEAHPWTTAARSALQRAGSR
jgi:cytochrome c oxidase assembly protein subunit 15